MLLQCFFWRNTTLRQPSRHYKGTKSWTCSGWMLYTESKLASYGTYSVSASVLFLFCDLFLRPLNSLFTITDGNRSVMRSISGTVYHTNRHKDPTRRRLMEGVYLRQGRFSTLVYSFPAHYTALLWWEGDRERELVLSYCTINETQDLFPQHGRHTDSHPPTHQTTQTTHTHTFTRRQAATLIIVEAASQPDQQTDRQTERGGSSKIETKAADIRI